MCFWVRPPTPSIPLGKMKPCQCTVVGSGSLFVTRMRTRSPFHGFDRGAGRLPVVTPAVHHHAGRELALHRLGDEMEFLHAHLSSPTADEEPFGVTTGL